MATKIKHIVINKDVCTGCRYCEIICSLTHEKIVNPKSSRIRVFYDTINGVKNPIVCQQCTDPACLKACKPVAITMDLRLGIPKVNPRKCVGCGSCIKACPSKAIFLDPQKSIAIKCDLCGGDPQCVKFCMQHAINAIVS